MFLNIEGDQKLIEDSLSKLAANLDVYETILSKQKYLGGDVNFLYSSGNIMALTAAIGGYVSGSVSLTLRNFASSGRERCYRVKTKCG